MKRWILIAVSLFPAAVVTGQETRALVNAEPAPLIFRLVPGGVPQGTDGNELIELVRAQPEQLITVPPLGLWSVPITADTLVGYYAGGPSAVSYRVVTRRLDAGREPVTIDRGDLAMISGRSVALTPWQVPDRRDSILIDGDSLDWEGVEPVLRFGSLFRPVRIEHAATGEVIPLSEAQFWETGGTRLFDLRARRGEASLYIAVRSYQDFTDGAGVHLRLFTDREQAALGEVVALLQGPGGPVVFRGPVGGSRLVGRYARRGRFLELDVLLSELEAVIPGNAPREITFDIATSVGIGERVEQFTFASFDPGISLPR